MKHPSVKIIGDLRARALGRAILEVQSPRGDLLCAVGVTPYDSGELPFEDAERLGREVWASLRRVTP